MVHVKKQFLKQVNFTRRNVMKKEEDNFLLMFKCKIIT